MRVLDYKLWGWLLIFLLAIPGIGTTQKWGGNGGRSLSVQYPFGCGTVSYHVPIHVAKYRIGIV